jgi:hypothetical protein
MLAVDNACKRTLPGSARVDLGNRLAPANSA